MVRRSLPALALLWLSTAWSQDPRGTITGLVADSSGAVIPGASVKATNLDTGVAVSAVSNDTGAYEIPYLNPGAYRLEVELQGFKTWAQARLELRMADRLRVDVTLSPGDVQEVVEVRDTAPLLESTTATVGQTISARQASDLPLRSGSVAYLFTMAPGVVMTALPYDGPWNVDQSSQLSVGGGRGMTSDFNIDGVTNNGKGGTTAYVPPPDMVQEVRVETSSYDAAVGHTTGGSINVTLKSGTNALHGTLGSSVSSGPMMTRNFFTNKFIFDPTTGPIDNAKIKSNTPSTRWLRHNAAVGGPVVLPKLYDGRNKTFWMFGYQSHQRRRPNATVHTVPTPEQRNGDFSTLLARGAQYQIYDPYTTVPSGALFSRRPLAGNVILRSRISSESQSILKYFPQPNVAGTADGLNNYARTRQDTQNLYQPMARIDHNFSERHRMFARYSNSNFYGHFDELIAGSKARGRLRRRPHHGAALDNVWVLSQAMVLDVRYGFTWFQEWQSFDNIGWDLKEFGFPDSLIRQLSPSGVSFPQIMVSGLLQLGNDGGFRTPSYNHTLLTVLNRMSGNHSWRFGFDGRVLSENSYTYGNLSPRLEFGETYTRGPFNNSTVAPTGQATASLLFGVPTGGYVELNDSRAERSRFAALFVQDDWRVTRKLTLNLGLRWEYDGPLTERYNRSTRDFDFAVANPIQAQAQAQYARSPIAEVPAAQFRTLGGLTFLGLDGQPRTQRDPSYRGFMPRIGYAWQVLPRIVVRGGYGIYFGAVGADFADATQPGFSQRTNVVASNDNGMTYVASIANPLPNGLEPVKGSGAGLRTYLGRSPGFTPSDRRRPYTQRWSTSLQIEPFRQTVFELGYMGSRSVRLRSSTEFNPTPRRYLSTSPVRDQVTIDFLGATVPNPFLGIDGFQSTGFYANRNTTRGQLLRPLPHFSGLSAGLPAGSSWYNALTARAERRLAAGFAGQINYTWSKLLEAIDYLNDTDPIPEHVVSNLDRPHRIAAMALYELPFGRGRRFGGGMNRLWNLVAGGWQVQVIWQLQSGPPLAFGNIIYTGAFTSLRLDHPTPERWFNISGFNRDSRQALASNIRTLPSRTSAARSAGIHLWDMSTHKTFTLHDTLRVQLRGEAEGIMNHPNFSPPNMNPTATLFGTVNGTQTGQEERRIFVGLKLMF